MTDKIDTSWKWGYSYCGFKLRFIGALDGSEYQLVWGVRWSEGGSECLILTDDTGHLKDVVGNTITKNPAPKVRMWTWIRHYPIQPRTMCVGDLFPDEASAKGSVPAHLTSSGSELLGPFPIEVEGIE